QTAGGGLTRVLPAGLRGIARAVEQHSTRRRWVRLSEHSRRTLLISLPWGSGRTGECRPTLEGPYEAPPADAGIARTGHGPLHGPLRRMRAAARPQRPNRP